MPAEPSAPERLAVRRPDAGLPARTRRPTEHVVTEEDWNSYARAVIDLAPPGRPPFRLIPDTPGTTGVWPRNMVPPVVIVTAWNPDSIILPEAENQACNQRLVAELNRLGVTLWPAVGCDLDSPHHEDGFAVSGLTLEEGVTLGAGHGQAAVFVWTPAALAAVSCSDDRYHLSGWRLTERLSDEVGTASA